ncbi:Methyltransferase type 12 domain protein [Candidatus Magnetomorum sp. HK-1]|nr:Methyltransferase type 12 domain protein [Candidatus Magnetomorum sp. HK-1]
MSCQKIPAIIRKSVRKIIKKAGYEITRSIDPIYSFHSNEYLRINARRLEHLASLKISVEGMTVLEVGAGIGDHSHYYIDRGCRITITEARTESLQLLKKRYPNCDIQFLDLDAPSPIEGSPFDVVHCYGLLYHLSKPKQALSFLSQHTGKILFLETCVSHGDKSQINLIEEWQSDPLQSFNGIGCRPTRTWLFKELNDLFEYVYVPKNQPRHEQFPVDWTIAAKQQEDDRLYRSVFIASREPLENEVLSSILLSQQPGHE